jgi:hypothetical protein
MIATMSDPENVRGPQQFGEIYPWLEQKKPAIRGGPKSGRKCRETAIAMYGDSRFQRVPYRTHGTSFRSLAGTEAPRPRRKAAAGVEISDGLLFVTKRRSGLRISLKL